MRWPLAPLPLDLLPCPPVPMTTTQASATQRLHATRAHTHDTHTHTSTSTLSRLCSAPTPQTLSLPVHSRSSLHAAVNSHLRTSPVSHRDHGSKSLPPLALSKDTLSGTVRPMARKRWQLRCLWRWQEQEGPSSLESNHCFDRKECETVARPDQKRRRALVCCFQSPELQA